MTIFARKYFIMWSECTNTSDSGTENNQGKKLYDQNN